MPFVVFSREARFNDAFPGVSIQQDGAGPAYEAINAPFDARVAGEAEPRYRIGTDGFWLGGGAAAPDARLYRVNAGADAVDVGVVTTLDPGRVFFKLAPKSPAALVGRNLGGFQAYATEDTLVNTESVGLFAVNIAGTPEYRLSSGNLGGGTALRHMKMGTWDATGAWAHYLAVNPDIPGIDVQILTQTTMGAIDVPIWHVLVTGDTNPRFEMNSRGTMFWGDGTTAQISRFSSNLAADEVVFVLVPEAGDRRVMLHTRPHGTPPNGKHVAGYEWLAQEDSANGEGGAIGVFKDGAGNLTHRLSFGNHGVGVLATPFTMGVSVLGAFTETWRVDIAGNFIVSIGELRGGSGTGLLIRGNEAVTDVTERNIVLATLNAATDTWVTCLTVTANGANPTLDLGVNVNGNNHTISGLAQLNINVAAANGIRFYEGANVRATIIYSPTNYLRILTANAAGNETDRIVLYAEADLVEMGLRNITLFSIHGGAPVKSSSATPIGYQVTNAALAVGSLGSMVIPVKTTTGDPNDAAIGDLDGAIYYNSFDNDLGVRDGADTVVKVALAGYNIPPEEMDCPHCHQRFEVGDAIGGFLDKLKPPAKEGRYAGTPTGHWIATHLACAIKGTKVHQDLVDYVERLENRVRQLEGTRS